MAQCEALLWKTAVAALCRVTERDSGDRDRRGPAGGPLWTELKVLTACGLAMEGRRSEQN